MAFRSPKRVFRERPTHKRWRNSLLILILLLGIFFAIVAVRTYRVYQSDLPSFEQLHNIEPSINTKVYDREGLLLKDFYSENRVGQADDQG